MNFESVTKVLQDNSTIVSEARALFEAGNVVYSETIRRLPSSTVHDQYFNSTVPKLLGNVGVLSREDNLFVSELLL